MRGVLPQDSTTEQITPRILFIRGQRVMLDADLARVYSVSTKRLNEQVKRNRHRFPKDFVFQLTADEKAEVVANCDHLRSLRFDYDHEADVLYISLKRPQRATDTVDRDGILMRYRGKELVGVTVLNASRRSGHGKERRTTGNGSR
ncbi:MAG: ORF6N domain-containing protein [Deltaproteobacteria bacterium]|nr:ORF6N domain-containing protein [Deltaproteobacteria bacterium]